MIDYYVYIRCHDIESMEVYIPWAKNGFLLISHRPHLIHFGQEDVVNFTEQYEAPFKIKHTFNDGLCSCGAKNVQVNVNTKIYKLMTSGVTQYCDQFLFEQSLRVFNKPDYDGAQIRIDTNMFDLSVIDSINKYAQILKVMEQ